MYSFKFKCTHRWQSDPNSHYLIIYTQSRLCNLGDPVQIANANPRAGKGHKGQMTLKIVRCVQFLDLERWGASTEWALQSCPKGTVALWDQQPSSAHPTSVTRPPVTREWWTIVKHNPLSPLAIPLHTQTQAHRNTHTAQSLPRAAHPKDHQIMGEALLE